MAYDEYLAERIRSHFRSKKVKAEEKKMMGGLTFMVNDKMCVGIIGDDMMIRIHPDEMETALQKPGIAHMVFTGKPMKGFLMATGEAIDSDSSLQHWIDRALAFNPLAKSSKKK